MVDKVREVRKELGKEEGELTQITADSGYFSVDNIEQEGQGIELLIASVREGKEEPQREKAYSLERFDYVRGGMTRGGVPEGDFWCANRNRKP